MSQNLKVVGSLEESSIFSVPWDYFEIQIDFDCKISKIKLYSVRALQCYLNEKHMIHAQVTATI